MGPVQLRSRGEQSLSIFLFAKDVFHKSETETLSNYNAWISARQNLGLSGWPVTSVLCLLYRTSSQVRSSNELNQNRDNLWWYAEHGRKVGWDFHEPEKAENLNCRENICLWRWRARFSIDVHLCNLASVKLCWFTPAEKSGREQCTFCLIFMCSSDHPSYSVGEE